ncbi:hypothetical protein NL676_021951 [Syzygium grande]|nr:hypothetical protein NL676_021951 [Syzygium grande]
MDERGGDDEGGGGGAEEDVRREGGGAALLGMDGRPLDAELGHERPQISRRSTFSLRGGKKKFCWIDLLRCFDCCFGACVVLLAAKSSIIDGDPVNGVVCLFAGSGSRGRRKALTRPPLPRVGDPRPARDRRLLGPQVSSRSGREDPLRVLLLRFLPFMSSIPAPSDDVASAFLQNRRRFESTGA